MESETERERGCRERREISERLRLRGKTESSDSGETEIGGRGERMRKESCGRQRIRGKAARMERKKDKGGH